MNFNIDLFKANLKECGLEISNSQIELLDKFAYLLTEKNKVLNLTAITDSDGIAIKHFADSISVMKATGDLNGKKVLDLGTGAGFPGVPLLIANPDIKLSMMDSTAKKLAFIDESMDTLSLNAETLHIRAEEAGKDKQYRETFDFVVSRAVASLNVLSEYCLPFVKPGGKFIAMKSAKTDEEIENARSAISILGGRLETVMPITLSDGAERNLVIIKKEKHTPPKYPRVSAQIAKKAL